MEEKEPAKAVGESPSVCGHRSQRPKDGQRCLSCISSCPTHSLAHTCCWQWKRAVSPGTFQHINCDNPRLVIQSQPNNHADVSDRIIIFCLILPSFRTFWNSSGQQILLSMEMDVWKSTIVLHWPIYNLRVAFSVSLVIVYPLLFKKKILISWSTAKEHLY